MVKSKKMAIGIYTKMGFVKPAFRTFQMAELFITTVKAKCNMASKILMAIGTISTLVQVLWLLVLLNYQMVGRYTIIHKAKCSMAIKRLIIINIILIQLLVQWRLVKLPLMDVTIITIPILGFKKKD